MSTTHETSLKIKLCLASFHWRYFRQQLAELIASKKPEDEGDKRNPTDFTPGDLDIDERDALIPPHCISPEDRDYMSDDVLYSLTGLERKDAEKAWQEEQKNSKKDEPPKETELPKDFWLPKELWLFFYPQYGDCFVGQVISVDYGTNTMLFENIRGYRDAIDLRDVRIVSTDPIKFLKDNPDSPVTETTPDGEQTTVPSHPVYAKILDDEMRRMMSFLHFIMFRNEKMEDWLRRNYPNGDKNG